MLAGAGSAFYAGAPAASEAQPARSHMRLTLNQLHRTLHGILRYRKWWAQGSSSLCA